MVFGKKETNLQKDGGWWGLTLSLWITVYLTQIYDIDSNDYFLGSSVSRSRNDLDSFQVL